jgi:hypothetical protein
MEKSHFDPSIRAGKAALQRSSGGSGVACVRSAPALCCKLRDRPMTSPRRFFYFTGAGYRTLRFALPQTTATEVKRYIPAEPSTALYRRARLR